MQVNSVSSNDIQSFGQTPEYKAPKSVIVERRALEGLANADNRQLQHLALKDASIASHDKEHKYIHRAIWYAMPVVAGLAAVVATPAKASKMLSGRIKNLGLFAGVAGGFALGLGIINAAFAGIQKLGSSFEATRNFDKKHPLLSLAGTIGAAYGVLTLAGAGISKSVEHLLKHVKPDMIERTLKKAAALDKMLVNNGVLNSVSKLAAKLPAPVKKASIFAPLAVPALIVFDFAQMIRHAANKNSIAYKNYDELKAAREEARTILKDMEQPKEPVVKAFKNIDVEDARIETDSTPRSEDSEIEE